mgnify:CR=1 FL=1
MNQGGPENADLLSITPVYPQAKGDRRSKPTLKAGETLTFTLHFAKCACWGTKRCRDFSPLPKEELARLVTKHFPEGWILLHDNTCESIRVVAYAIALAESSGIPGICGDRDTPAKGYCSIGLWQINTYWHDEYEPHRLFEPEYNAQAAAKISRGGKDWQQWSTWTDETRPYTKHLVTAREALGIRYTYDAVAGWYLVSTPVAANPAIYGGRVLNLVTERWESVPCIEPTKGYWVQLPAQKTVTVTGTPIATDVSIDISAIGWHQISSPWPYPKTAILVTRGGEMKSWSDAVAAGWVDDQIYGYRATDGRYTTSTIMDPWYGYFVGAKVSGLSLRLLYASRITTMCIVCLTADEPKAAVVPMSLPPLPPEPPGSPVGAPSVTCTPNPVGREGAAFFYHLPTETQNARLVIFDVAGRLVAGIPLDPNETRYPTTGKWNPVDRNGIPLANGPYIYVLIADGRVIGQGKMVIQR